MKDDESEYIYSYIYVYYLPVYYRCCYVEETRDLCRACVDNPLICTTIMRYEWTMAGQSESTQEIKTPKPNCKYQNMSLCGQTVNISG